MQNACSEDSFSNIHRARKGKTHAQTYMHIYKRGSWCMQMPVWTCLNQLIAGSAYCRAIRYLATSPPPPRPMGPLSTTLHFLCLGTRSLQHWTRAEMFVCDQFDGSVVWIGRCNCCLFLRHVAQSLLAFHTVCYELWWARKSGLNCVKMQNKNFLSKKLKFSKLLNSVVL